MNFKEWFSENEWKILRKAIENGCKTYMSLKNNKNKTENKKVKKPKTKPEDLHKWLLEQKKKIF